MERDIVTTYKNNGIISPFVSVFKYLLKQELYLRQLFVMQNPWKPGISYSSKRIYALYWLHHVSLYKNGFHCNINLFLIDNVYDYSHICCPWPENDPVWFLGTKVNVKHAAWPLHRFCTGTQPSFVIRWWHPHSCCQWPDEDPPGCWIKYTWSKVIWSYKEMLSKERAHKLLYKTSFNIPFRLV